MARPGRGSIMRVPLLRDIISSGQLIPNFQPIISIDEPSQIVGFESLMRYGGGPPWSNPALLFDYAERKGSIVELDNECVKQSVTHGAALTAGQLLFINVRPELLSRPDLLTRTVIESASASGVSLSRLVLEITEDAAISNRAAAIDNLRRLQERGVRFAIDDVGMSHSHLNMIDEIRPAFLKISHEFGREFESDPTKIRIVRNIVALAHDFSAEVILEGIETPNTHRFAKSLGIQRGQGYLFSRPLPSNQAQMLVQSDDQFVGHELH